MCLSVLKLRNMLGMRSVPNRNTKNLPVAVHVLRQRGIWSFYVVVCRGRRRNVPRFITHVHFSDIAIAVAGRLSALFNMLGVTYT